MTRVPLFALVSILAGSPPVTAQDVVDVVPQAATASAGAVPADLAPLTAVERWLADPTAILPSDGLDLADFQWVARPIVIFADTPADPRFRQQVALLEARVDELARRDVVIIVDTAPKAAHPVRQTLRPRGFMVTLVGKDGGVKLRKPTPWDVREFTHAIDKMPERKDEIRAERDIGG